MKSVHDNILLKYWMRKFEELPDLYEEKLQELRDAAMKLARNTKEALKQIIEWIRSRDPVSTLVRTLIVGSPALFYYGSFLSE